MITHQQSIERSQKGNKSILKFANSFSKASIQEPDISLRKAAHDKFKRTQILEEANILQEKIQEKDVETDENNILSSDNSMSDDEIIPSEFEGKE